MRRRCLSGMLALAAAGVAACAGDSVPTAPTPPTTTSTPTAPSTPGTLPGIWTGYLNTQRCIVGGQCSGYFENVPFTLRLADAAGGFNGFLEINKTGLLGWFPITVDIRGVAEADGAVRFSSLHTPAESDNAAIEIGELVVRTSPVSGLAGPIDVGGWWPDSSVDRRYRGSIASAAYRPLDGPTVSGGWSGQAIIRSCSGACANSLSAGRKVGIDLQLGQAGQQVTGRIDFDIIGSLAWFPVAGTLSGNLLALSSEPLVRVNAAQPVRLVQYSVTIDPRGMMMGRFTFDGDSGTAANPNKPFRLECDIQWLTRDF